MNVVAIAFIPASIALIMAIVDLERGRKKDQELQAQVLTKHEHKNENKATDNGLTDDKTGNPPAIPTLTTHDEHLLRRAGVFTSDPACHLNRIEKTLETLSIYNQNALDHQFFSQAFSMRGDGESLVLATAHSQQAGEVTDTTHALLKLLQIQVMACKIDDFPAIISDTARPNLDYMAR